MSEFLTFIRIRDRAEVHRKYRTIHFIITLFNVGNVLWRVWVRRGGI